MTTAEFARVFRDRAVLFDGGMGTMLQRSGIAHEGCPEMLNLTNAADVAAVHAAYARAGARFVETNTLGANRIALARHGLSQRAAELTAAGVRCAKAGAPDAYVAVSMGPTGRILEPLGDCAFKDAYGAYREQAMAAAEAGADAVIVETMGDVGEARIAVLAVRENTAMPVIASVTFEPNGRMLMGATPETAARILTAAGAAAMGINCSGGPMELLPCLERMIAGTDLPIIVQPNAGLPEVVEGVSVYPVDAEAFARTMRDILEAGASGVGGCCGTTPEHIAALRTVMEGIGGKARGAVERKLCAQRGAMAVDAARGAGVLRCAPGMTDALLDEVDGDVAWLDVTDLGTEEIAAYILEAQSLIRQPMVFTAGTDSQYAAALRAYHGVAGVGANCGAGVRTRYGAVAVEG